MATLQQLVHHIMTQLTANTCYKKLQEKPHKKDLSRIAENVI